jgi:hypothetical protein
MYRVVRPQLPVRKLFDRLIALRPGATIEVDTSSITQRTYAALCTMAYRNNVRIFRVDRGDGITTLACGPRRQPHAARKPAREPGLSVVSEQDEQERFASALHRYSQRRQIACPRASDVLQVLKHLGYERVSPGDFDNWLVGF